MSSRYLYPCMPVSLFCASKCINPIGMNDPAQCNVCLDLIHYLGCPYCDPSHMGPRDSKGEIKDESSCFVQVLSIPYILIQAMSYSLVQWHFTECLWLGSDRMLSCAVTGLLKQQAIQDAKWKWADCAISMATVWSNRGDEEGWKGVREKPSALKNNFLCGSRTT